MGGALDGAAFGPYARWAAGLGAGAGAPLLGDVSGDGRADAVLFDERDGGFTVAQAGAGAFQPAAQWRRGLGTSLRGGAVQPLLGDVTGEGRQDAAAFWRR